MKRTLLKELLNQHLVDLEAKPWTVASVDKLPSTIEYDEQGVFYQIELVLLEYLDEKRKAHIGVSIDDSKFLSSMFPVSSSFIVTLEPANDHLQGDT